MLCVDCVALFCAAQELENETKDKEERKTEEKKRGWLEKMRDLSTRGLRVKEMVVRMIVVLQRVSECVGIRFL